MPNVVVIAGPNGAGKSTTAPDVLQKAFAMSGEKFINADTIAADLQSSATGSVAFRAGRIMLDRMHGQAGAGADFAFETTLASRSFAPWLRNLQRGGYVLHLVYFWLPSADLAVERVAERVRRGGHNVPEPVVRRRYDKSLANFFNLYRPFADSWLMLDNSRPTAPQAIAWRNAGGPVQIVKGGPWYTLRERYEKDIFDRR